MYVDSTLCDDNDVRYDSIFQKRTLRDKVCYEKSLIYCEIKRSFRILMSNLLNKESCTEWRNQKDFVILLKYKLISAMLYNEVRVLFFGSDYSAA